MKSPLNFRAQSADGISPAHLELHGQSIAEAAEEDRKSAADEISVISQRGRVLWDQDGAKIIRYGQQIIVKLHANEPDESGRLMPIVCWGRMTGTDLEAFGRIALSGLDAFAKRMNRTIKADHVMLLQQAFRIQKQKQANRKKLFTLTVAATALAIGCYAVAQRSSTDGEPKNSLPN